MAHHSSPMKKIDPSLNDLTEIIDFSQIDTEDELNRPDAESNEEDDESDFDTHEAEEQTNYFQYNFIAKTEPPKGLTLQCKLILWFQWPWYVWLRSQFLLSDSEKVRCGMNRGYVSVQSDRFRHVVLYPYMIHPYSNFALVWNIFVGISTAIILIYSPYMIAFQSVRFYTQQFLVISAFGSFTLVADTVMRFFMGVVEPYSWNIILDPTKVSSLYLKGWFIYDILTGLPWDLAYFLILPVEDRKLKPKLAYIRVLSFFLRVMRYRSVYEMKQRLVSIFAFSGPLTILLFKLSILFFFTLHWLACFHWLLPNVFHDPSSPKPRSWVTHSELWGEPHWIQYINSFLRSLSNLLTLDGGNYIPREPEEILCTCIGVVLWLRVFGFLISTFSTILSETDSAEDKFTQLLELVEDYLVFQKVPLSFRERVLLYFEKRYHKHIFSDAVLLATLSPNLRTEVITHNCRILIQRVPIFKDLPQSVKVNLSNHLEYEVFVPGDILIYPNTVGDRMYFIQNGEVDIMNKFGTLLTTLTDGHFFGEISLITGEKRMKTAKAKAASEIYILTKENFDKCVTSCPEVYKRILKVAQSRLEDEFKATLEAARRVEDFKKWKEARKKLAKEIEEENKYVVDSSGITFIEDNVLNSESDSDDFKSAASVKTQRSNKTFRSKMSSAKSEQTRPRKIGQMLDNVKDLANFIKEKAKKKTRKKKK